jgi:hypothetical protein
MHLLRSKIWKDFWSFNIICRGQISIYSILHYVIGTYITFQDSEANPFTTNSRWKARMVKSPEVECIHSGASD